MPAPGTPLDQLGFLTIGTFDPADPGPGHEATLATVELGEQLAFDSAWLRHRHLQHGISSPIAVLAALTQRTRRIRLGTAVTPLAWENPLRLAEDLATVDVLSRGRLNPGVSVGPPMHWDDVKEALYPDTADAEDFGYGRVLRLLRFLRGERACSPAARASSRSGRTACSRTPPAWPVARGTAAAACARRRGPASTGCTS
jgi:alkanesulfonate monooxygenase SsuD/methylene tetrahydromethanopterin reductase-like flavin-dependent oxidoreductase (luciferase family)